VVDDWLANPTNLLYLAAADHLITGLPFPVG
jgi:hypothetical protein